MSQGTEIIRDGLLATLGYAAAANAVYLAVAIRAVRRRAPAAARQPEPATRDSLLRSPLTPPVSVVAAVRNDAAGVVERVDALLALRYPEHEVVVVDAGSEDGTLARLEEAYELASATRALRRAVPGAAPRAAYRSLRQNRLVVLAASGGDRAGALNLGIRAARHPYVLVVASDAVPGEDALLAAAEPLAEGDAEPAVLGVAEGIERPDGRLRGLAQGFDRLEALRSGVWRRAGAGGATGCVLAFVRPGFVLCSRARLERIGGYDAGAGDPDLDLVLRLGTFAEGSASALRTVGFGEASPSRPARRGMWTLLRVRAAERAATVRTLGRQARMRRHGPGAHRPAGAIALAGLLVLGPLVELLPLAAVIAGLVSGSLTALGAGVLAALGALPGVLLLASALASAPARPPGRPGTSHLLGLAPLALFMYLGYRQCIAAASLVGSIRGAISAAPGPR